MRQTILNCYRRCAHIKSCLWNIPVLHSIDQVTPKVANT